MTDVSATNAAEQRVQQFMVEFEGQWRLAAPAFEERGSKRAAFEAWRALMDETRRRHFTDDTAVDLGQSFGSPAEYGPASSTFLRSERQGDAVHVLTRGTSGLRRFRDHTLRQQGGEWRIASIASHPRDPVERFVDEQTVAVSLGQVAEDAPLGSISDEQAQLDETLNFTERVVVRPRDGETTRTEVSEVGTLVTSTGVLAVLDFGYGNDDARPLARTVAPGTYPIDRVTGFGRNAAVRVRFSDRVPVSWHPASLPAGGHVIGVDAGCGCIVDHVAYAAMTRRDKAAVYDRFTTAARPAVLEVPLGATDLGIAFDTGYGDGSYPVYWGVDEQGRTAQLVVDCMVLVAQDDDGVLTHL
ncbi:hypothetical protein C8046_16815 [Serinibacter arcticus]|uniref:DUF4241 domain-containing protein n=1 Tax=Serinibacter arcticus TaxID=1655435 RepID=A0A2U1ZYP2_9MICO|nr:DUF4241 domain-containing protein [Serinibacter arcticus]PWD52060.1 hypothetical protein C8046_16815 [Serinibacter arcticus]